MLARGYRVRPASRDVSSTLSMGLLLLIAHLGIPWSCQLQLHLPFFPQSHQPELPKTTPLFCSEHRKLLPGFYHLPCSSTGSRSQLPLPPFSLCSWIYYNFSGQAGSACLWDQTSPGFSSLAVPVTNWPSECNFDTHWSPTAQEGIPRSSSIELYWGKPVESVLGPKDSSARQSQEGHVAGQGSLSLPRCSWGPKGGGFIPWHFFMSVKAICSQV